MYKYKFLMNFLVSSYQILTNRFIQGYEINQGDYLKFGRVRYRIKDINLSTEENA